MKSLRLTKSALRTLNAGFAGMFLFLTAATTLQLPYHFSWYILHRRLMFPSRLVLGWAQIAIWEFIPTLYPLKRIEVIYVITAATLGFLGSLLMYFLWTKRWIGKVLVGLFILTHILVGWFLSFWLGDLVRSPAEICRVAVTDNVSIRILGYGPQNESWFDNYFVLSTVDRGQTWNQVLVQYYDTWDMGPPPPDCEGQELYYQTLPNDEFIWIWTKENLSISNDGGRSWQSWTPSCGVRERCEYGSIIAVTFEDPKRGHMKASLLFKPRGVVTDLYSSDGGLTWSRVP
ncbi:MAG: hypothetical protein L0331_32885 [Chloroflexi bacterium]|nr:hypothetical protein [Chloroflexota bacterium]MCI0645347.1 hypothetical protein [Chloroflexota bacterium]